LFGFVIKNKELGPAAPMSSLIDFFIFFWQQKKQYRSAAELIDAIKTTETYQ
jgi:hypothetical protein